MAAESLGGFLYGFKRNQIRPTKSEVVWVKKRFNPTDLRSNAPVPRSKFLLEQKPSRESAIPTHWKKEVEPSLKTFSRHFEEEKWYPSSQATRCEEWSTLRQILPSRGIPNRVIAPRWGTELPIDPNLKHLPEKKFPHINSPMTR